MNSPPPRRVEDDAGTELEWLTFDEYGPRRQVLYDADECDAGLEAYVIADPDVIVDLSELAGTPNAEVDR